MGLIEVRVAKKDGDSDVFGKNLLKEILKIGIKIGERGEKSGANR